MVNRALNLAIRSADHLMLLGQPEAAATILENYLLAHPPAAQVFSRLGRIRLEQGNAAEAAKLLERSLRCSSEARRTQSEASPVRLTCDFTTSGLTITGGAWDGTTPR